eukprot:CAMPEP_0118650232 /NCGR_PEP_ID=MMETSP0785-20121206/10136_1 /TAXON_ID=91992 /ORGANISM="Bolidomonas pacifica, Strain CCMP 1866" /LENGTH=90 /DNA_ID=CAMNT_0006542591 /DNA_START=639 /DNA_END=908 /DNA_ORIENTATION=+
MVIVRNIGHPEWGARGIRKYFERIGVEGRKLRYRAVGWNSVVSRMVSAQKEGRYKVAVKDFDEWDVSARVNRWDNLMVCIMGRRDSPVGE